MHIICFDTIDSTMNYAKNHAEKLTLPTLIIANSQTDGRGRQGKSFYSPKNGVYFTLLFKANSTFDLITPAAAVSVCKSIKEICHIDTQIKWVNDIFYEGKKICGILTERFTKNETTYTSVGIGINLNTADFPSELPNAGSLKTNINGNFLAQNIAKKILEYNINYDKSQLIDDYKSKLFILGKEITYSIDNIQYIGIPIDINEECNLIVQNSDSTKIALKSGEISILIR